MLYALVATVIILVPPLAFYRRSFLRERPIELGTSEYASATALARDLAAKLGLEAQQRPPGVDWLADFLLLPVLLLWGDHRMRRPSARLTRWTLHGTRNDRHVDIALDPDDVRVKLELRRPINLRADAATSLEQQEGLRALHPVGESRWQEGTQRLRALFATGVTAIDADTALTAHVPLEAFTQRADTIISALSDFAALL